MTTNSHVDQLTDQISQMAANVTDKLARLTEPVPVPKMSLGGTALFIGIATGLVATGYGLGKVLIKIGQTSTGV